MASITSNMDNSVRNVNPKIKLTDIDELKVPKSKKESSCKC